MPFNDLSYNIIYTIINTNTESCVDTWWQKHLKTLVDPSRVPGVDQGPGVADLHQVRRVDVVFVLQRLRGPPERPASLLKILLGARLRAAQIDLHLVRILPSHHAC